MAERGLGLAKLTPEPRPHPATAFEPSAPSGALRGVPVAVPLLLSQQAQAVSLAQGASQAQPHPASFRTEEGFHEGLPWFRRFIQPPGAPWRSLRTHTVLNLAQPQTPDDTEMVTITSNGTRLNLMRNYPSCPAPGLLGSEWALLPGD